VRGKKQRGKLFEVKGGEDLKDVARLKKKKKSPSGAPRWKMPERKGLFALERMR